MYDTDGQMGSRLWERIFGGNLRVLIRSYGSLNKRFLNATAGTVVAITEQARRDILAYERLAISRNDASLTINHRNRRRTDGRMRDARKRREALRCVLTKE